MNFFAKLILCFLIYTIQAGESSRHQSDFEIAQEMVSGFEDLTKAKYISEEEKEEEMTSALLENLNKDIESKTKVKSFVKSISKNKNSFYTVKLKNGQSFQLNHSIKVFFEGKNKTNEFVKFSNFILGKI